MATPPSGSIPNSHAVYGVQLFLKIKGVKYPVVSATIENTLNQIPVASVTVPVGLKISKDNEADINGLSIQERTKAEIVMSASGKPHPTGVSVAYSKNNIVDEVIFEGYVIAVHNHVSVQSVSTTLVIFNWSDDLDISTLAFGDFAKIAPNDWFTENDAPETGAAFQFPFPLASGVWLRKDDIVSKNWWSDIITPGVIYKTERPAHKFVNTSASRLPNNLVRAPFTSGKIIGRLILNSKAREAIKSNDRILENIGYALTSVIMGSAGGSSVFEKIVSLAKEFRFMLTHSWNPRLTNPHHARVFPYNPVRGVTVELTDKEFDFGPGAPNPTAVPAALMLYSNKAINPYMLVGNQKQLDAGFIGQYPPASAVASRGVATGPFLTMPVPSWMEEGLPGPYLFDQASKGLIISPAGSKNSSQPQTPSSPPVAGTNFADLYAQALYFDALFAARTQDIVCGYRRDINPGDVIAVSFRKNIKNTKIRKRGMVNSVIMTFSAGERATVNVTYKLKHVFDEGETRYFGFDFYTGIPHPIFED